jgi:hypothetical protein
VTGPGAKGIGQLVLSDGVLADVCTDLLLLHDDQTGARATMTGARHRKQGQQTQAGRATTSSACLMQSPPS